MPEGGILLDLTSCRDWGMVQDAIRRAFGFPAHYGENWDAMWDCLTDLFWVTDDRHIVVRGLDALPPRICSWQQYTDTGLLECSRHCRRKHANGHEHGRHCRSLWRICVEFHWNGDRWLLE